MYWNLLNFFFRTDQLFLKSFFISRRSITTSIIQSASATFSKSSSKFPVLIREAKFLLYKGAGFDFKAFCNALLALNHEVI